MNHIIFEDTSTKKKINCYDCHDGKMIYLLPKCSLWKNKHHPFIICKCRRNIGVQQNDHKYEMFTDEEYERLWNRSKRCYQSKLTTEDAHRNWCDSDNYGGTHFGISPSLLPIITIQFDVFHLQYE
jgi:hypothetical protein